MTNQISNGLGIPHRESSTARNGITALPVALVEPVTKVSAWGFVAQGLIWMSLLCAGIYAIRKGDAARHRACMVLMLAVMSGAMVFRIALAAFAAWGDYANFNAFYAGNAWFAWALPLSLTLLWLRREQSDSLKF
jgi:hypothetical protein